VLLYSELDDDRWEIRKVEIFADGTCGWAGSNEANGPTRLGEAPVPSVAKIAADPEFDPVEIERGEFEEVWARRRRPPRST
jgi:hypothetical protein